MSRLILINYENIRKVIRKRNKEHIAEAYLAKQLRCGSYLEIMH